jgi:hypothetical protein
MFGRMAALMRKDVKAGLRDSLLVYMIAAPVLFAVLMLGLIPLIEGSSVGFAVAGEFEPRALEALERHGAVERLAGRAEVVARVEQSDHLIGVFGGGEVEVIVEGNEPAGLRELPGRILARLEDAERATVRAPEDPGPGFDMLVWTGLLFMVVLLPGFAVGLTIMSDRETGALSAFNASPMSFGDYAGSKALEVAALTLLTGAAVVGITRGAGAPWGLLLMAIAGSAPIGLLLGVLLGALANDQLTAIAYIKGLSFGFASLPLAGFVASAPAVYAFYAMPTYWSLLALYSASIGDAGEAARASALAFGTSAPLVAGALWFLKRKTGAR